jgi:phospholipid transport system substrate-binding protein
MRRPLVPAAALAAAALLGAVALAEASVPPAEEEARRFVQQTIDDVLGVLHDQALSLEQKKDKVESIAYERVDFELICRFVLARNWKTLSEQQQRDFVDAFKKHLSATYRDTLDSFRDEKITVEGSSPEARGDVTVRTIVIIEGVSLVQNFRTQVQEIISTEGADALIQKLRDKQIKLDTGTKEG